MSFLSHELMSLRCDVSKKCIQSAKKRMVLLGRININVAHFGPFYFLQTSPISFCSAGRFQDSPHVEFISKHLSCSHVSIFFCFIL